MGTKETAKERAKRRQKEKEALEQLRLKKWFDDDRPKPKMKLKKTEVTHHGRQGAQVASRR